MAFEDRFRLSSHAVITNELGQVLLLKANYGNFAWGLPGGALEPGETIHEALLRECRKLMFSHLLLSRHSVIWPEDVADIQVPQFTSRYLLLAWLLSLLSVLPADATLTLDCSQPDAWHAHFPEDLASAAPTALPAFAPEEVELLATVSGWRLERQAQCWSLRLPAAPPAQ